MSHFHRLLAGVIVSAGLIPLQAQSGPAVATLTVASNANPAVYGQPLAFTVAVIAPFAGSAVPTGSISASLPGGYPLGTVSVDGSGRGVLNVPQPAGLFAVVPWGLGAGSNTITFSYSGDARYVPAQSTYTQWVDKADTSTAAYITGNSQPYLLTATVTIHQPLVTSAGFVLLSGSSAPSGPVQFFNGTTLIGTAQLAPVSQFTSVATFPVGPTPAFLAATYSGDANFNGSSSTGAVQPGSGAVSLAVVSSANPSVYAAPVTLKFAVTPTVAGGPAATGSVSASIQGLFGLGSVTLDATGHGVLTVPQNPGLTAVVPWGFSAGANSLVLTYGGDTYYAKAQTSFTQVVNKAGTATLAVVSADGLSVQATVAINESSVTTFGFGIPGGSAGNANPTGNVQFQRGGTVIGTAALNPVGHLQSAASVILNPFPTSSGDILAVYAGDANYKGSTSPPATQPSQSGVNLTVTSSANPATFAAPVTFSVKVVAAAGGAVPSGSVHASVLGSYTLGDAVLDGTGFATFTVPQDPGPRASPVATWGLGTGGNVITVTYSGDSNYTSTQTVFNQLVIKAETVTNVALPPVAFGTTSFPVTANVEIHQGSVSKIGFSIPNGASQSSSPTGTVDFYDGAKFLGTVSLIPGTTFHSSATITVIAPLNSLQAIYHGDSNYNPSSWPGATSPLNLPVGITLASSANPVLYGGALTIAATVTPLTPGPIPTGTLTFYEGSRNLGWIAALDSAGRGTLPIPEPLAAPAICPPCPAAAPVMVLGAGAHVITVQYSGDGNYAAVSPAVSLTQQITKAPASIALEFAGANVLGGALHIIADVADAQPPAGGPFHFMVMGAAGVQDGNPSGSVQFLGDSLLIGTAALIPSAVSNVTSNAGINATSGTAFAAVYSGDANFLGTPVLPVKRFTSVTVSSGVNPCSAGQSVTLTASALAAATGTVDFLDGTALLGRVAVNGGTATLTTNFTSLGTHALTANYNGDTNYAASVSPVFNQVALPQNVPGVLNLSAVATTAVFGEQIVFTVLVTGNGTVPPHGLVYFLDGANYLGAGSLSLSSTHLIMTLPVGKHPISAVWAGDDNWPAAKSAVLVMTVNRAPTVTTLTSGLAITVSAVPPGAGTPTGTVQLIDSGNQFVLAKVTLSGGAAQVTLFVIYDPPIAGGNGILEAVYSGDANFAPSTSRVLPAIYGVDGRQAFSLAPEEIATIYGDGLATVTAAAPLLLPTLLAGASVMITDSAGATRAAALYYASPDQINFVVPAGTASGPASVKVAGYGIQVTVRPVAPTLFPTAQIVRVHADGSQSIEDASAPIAFGSDSLYLVLYATGIRNRTSLDHVVCNFGNKSFPVTYAGSQSQYTGLDQVVVPLPASLKGTGFANVVLTADGYSSTSISVTFQ